MCLYSKNKEALIAKKDIVCYKVLDDCGDFFETPFRHKKIERNVVCKNGEYGPMFRDDPNIITDSCVEISGGYIHTYINWLDTLELVCDLMEKTKLHNKIIYKCVIPKGTEYYRGCSFRRLMKGDRKDTDYASKKIKFVKRIYPQ